MAVRERISEEPQFRQLAWEKYLWMRGGCATILFWRKTQTNAVDLDEASEWLPNGERNAEQQILAREQVAQVWQAVKGLSERQRTVFLLRYVEERELSEIAAATGLSEGTVKAHLSRALGRVRTELRGTQ